MQIKSSPKTLWHLLEFKGLVHVHGIQVYLCTRIRDSIYLDLNGFHFLFIYLFFGIATFLVFWNILCSSNTYIQTTCLDLIKYKMYNRRMFSSNIYLCHFVLYGFLCNVLKHCTRFRNSFKSFLNLSNIKLQQRFPYFMRTKFW